MFEMKGKYTTAKIMIDSVEEACVSQIQGFLNHIAFTNPVAIMPDCLSEDTEILTDTGFVPILHLKETQRIANYDIEDNSAFFQIPESIIVREKRENEGVFSLTSKRLDLSIISSENHRNALKNSPGVRTKDLPQTLPIKDFYWSAKGLKNPACKINLVDSLLIAWIVGDGNIKITKNKTDNERIRFGIKKERKIKRILQLCTEAGLSPKVTPTERFTEIMLNTEESRKYIGYVSREKKYPIQMLSMDNATATAFIKELVQIDGDYEAFKKYGTIRINSKRIEDVEFISGLACLNYGSAVIKSRVSDRIIKGKRYKGIMYYVNIIPEANMTYNRNGLHNSKMVKSNYSYKGKLVCVTCTSGFFIARRLGRTFITGNCHAGKGSVVGFTMPMGQKIIANTIGVDIGCGMRSVNLGPELKLPLAELDHKIRQRVPFGFDTNEKPILDMKKDFPWKRACSEAQKFALAYQERFGTGVELPKYDMDWFTGKCQRIGCDLGRGIKSLGSLGGGNHFIEIGLDQKSNYWLTIHTGSRNYGKCICEYWQEKAIKKVKKQSKEDRQLALKELKATYTGKDLYDRIKAFKSAPEVVPEYGCSDELRWLEGEDAIGYLFDMVFAQIYAEENRTLILSSILDALKLDPIDSIETVHNFIDFKDFIIRKGSIRSYTGERMVIPFNMRDGILLCEGKSNPEWNFSAPHGAGRVLSRGQAKKHIDLEIFKTQMEGIFSTSIGQGTLDEAPDAYKDCKVIEEAIEPTAVILDRIKPVLNMKAFEVERE